MKATLSPRIRLAIAFSMLFAPAVPAEPVITEFMAANSSTLYDEDGDASDWIEIHNPDALPVDLHGWSLTDSAKSQTKWTFPALELPAGGYLVVFASGKNRRDPAAPLHTNFSLDADGEYLALVRPDGTGASTEFAPAYPAQARDFTYGSIDGAFASVGPLARPTPGSANTAPHLTATVTFSRDSGTFAQPFTLELRGAGAGQVIRYLLAAPGTPLNRALELSSSSLEYRGPLTLNPTTVVCAAVFAADGTASGPVASAHFIRTTPDMALFSSRLPVIVIDTLGTGALMKDDLDHPAWLYAFGPALPGRPVFDAPPATATPLTLSVRGSSSAEFPKKGYNLKLRDGQAAARPLPLLDLPASETWALVAPWSFDVSYLNNAFVYDLSNRIGRWAPRTRFAEVFLSADGGALDTADYAGIYVLTERIAPGPARLSFAAAADADGGSAASTRDYILKIDHAEPSDFTWSSLHRLSGNGDSSVILAYPKPGDATPAQRDYISGYVRRMEAALQADAMTGWRERTSLEFVDRPSWVDHHLLNTFVCNPDAFERSAYFTKDGGGKLVAGPVWDFDRALGCTADARSARWDAWSCPGGTDVWRMGWWGTIARDPEFIQDWVDRWQGLRRAELSRENLVSRLDSLASAIGPEAAARDAARWPDNASPYGSHAAQIEHLKTWLVQRAAWIDGQFVAPPSVEGTVTTLTFTPSAGAQLAYTLDGSDPRSLGGDFSPTARLIPGPLVVPASANVHVRAFRPAPGTLPSSPWSSAVSGPVSSPLLPRARLVNLSSRAQVGSGENALLVGAVVADATAKRYLSRAIGPGLANFGAAGVIRDPRLSIRNRVGTELFFNVDWQTADHAADLPRDFTSVGAFPLTPGSGDAALACEMAAGAYTLHVTSAGGASGIGLAELYELDTTGRTVNLSVRTRVGREEGALVGGFVVQGPAYKQILVRAAGPGLAALGITDALTEPSLTIYSGQAVIAANEAWSSASDSGALERATQAVGAFRFAAGSRDAAVLLTLPPGAYTAEVKGQHGGEGIALLEIYDVP